MLHQLWPWDGVTVVEGLELVLGPLFKLSSELVVLCMVLSVCFIVEVL